MNCSVGLLGEEVRMKESETTTWKIPGVTDEEYFGDYDKYLTASQLKAFADCPWLADYQRRNPETKSDTDALFFGRAVHCCTLEGKEEFLARFEIGGEPVNPKTGKPYGSDSQKFQQWLESLPPGSNVISSKKANDAIELADCVHGHEIAGELLRYGEPEICFRGQFQGIPVQSKIDWLGAGYICDLKTCQSLKQFEASFFRFKYDLQAAFYTRMVSPHLESRFYFIAVEKQFPNLVAVYQVKDETLGAAQKRLDHLLVEYKEAIRNQRFVTRTEEVRSI